MSTKELKKKLIDKIEEEQSNDLLEEVLSVFERTSVVKPVYVFNQGQLAAIAKSREQIVNGNYFTDDEVNQEIEEWLNNED